MCLTGKCNKERIRQCRVKPTCCRLPILASMSIMPSYAYRLSLASDSWTRSCLTTRNASCCTWDSLLSAERMKQGCWIRYTDWSWQVYWPADDGRSCHLITLLKSDLLSILFKLLKLDTLDTFVRKLTFAGTAQGMMYNIQWFMMSHVAFLNFVTLPIFKQSKARTVVSTR